MLFLRMSACHVCLGEQCSNCHTCSKKRKIQGVLVYCKDECIAKVTCHGALMEAVEHWHHGVLVTVEYPGSLHEPEWKKVKQNLKRADSWKVHCFRLLLIQPYPFCPIGLQDR